MLVVECVGILLFVVMDSLLFVFRFVCGLLRVFFFMCAFLLCDGVLVCVVCCALFVMCCLLFV